MKTKQLNESERYAEQMKGIVALRGTGKELTMATENGALTAKCNDDLNGGQREALAKLIAAMAVQA